MVVAFVALVLSGTGSALAVVSYARNAGAVDGRSATIANVSLSTAAGKLVATARGGALKGKIPNKYLDAVSRSELSGYGRAVPFSKAIDVTDNAVSAPQDVNAITSVGTLSMTCADQNNAANVENPTVTLRFTNLSGSNLAVARNVEGNGATVSTLVPGAIATLTINGSNAYEWSIQRGGTNVSIHGAVQEINPGTTAATCLAFGSSLVAG
jgi:hypothetical protein